MNKPVVLIMTATITPPAICPDLKRKDPILRLNDYCEALEFYLNVSTKYIDRIIFVENSNSDLCRLREITKKYHTEKIVEFLEYKDGNIFPPEYGKGYGEMTLMNFALDNSSVVRGDDIYWKSTGRLIITNIEEMIRSAPLEYNIYCDLHKEYKIISSQRFFDARLYSFRIDGYNEFLRTEENQLKYSHIEHLYYDKIIKKIPNEKIVPRFRRQPFIKGFAAASNENYFSLNKIIKRLLQNYARLILPNFWI